MTKMQQGWHDRSVACCPGPSSHPLLFECQLRGFEWVGNERLYRVKGGSVHWRPPKQIQPVRLLCLEGLVSLVASVIDKKMHLAGVVISHAFTAEVVDGTQLIGAV